MSVYNGADRLREAIESVLSQEGVSLEFIVIDDGSTDGTDVIIGEYARHDTRVKILHPGASSIFLQSRPRLLALRL